MKRIAKKFALITIIGLFATTPSALAAKPMWVKKATAFPEQCDPGKTQACKPVRIPSPDGKSTVEVLYRKQLVTAPDDWILQAYLRVTTPGEVTREAALPEGFQSIDLLWSPDSRAFFVDGGNGGAIWGFWVYVYLINDSQLRPRHLTREAELDMLKTFPPCKAAAPTAEECNFDPKTCDEVKMEEYTEDEYNMTGIDWITPSSILVMTEIPCSTSYGGIMCQVMGYELEVSTGRILKRIDAKDLKLRWQKSMAWNFRVPDPPQYCFHPSNTAQ